MKEIYLELVKLLETVQAIRWTDLDKGQLEFYESRPALAFPAALIRVEVTQTETIGNNVQRCNGRGTIRLIFDYTGETAAATPKAIQTQSLTYFDTVEAVYKAVQGKAGGIGKFNRQSVLEERREDGFKVVNIPFACSWLDKTASY